ncbi:hypothetical protein AMJ40_02580 [candidate division TA06 bacterium DG_26]|uniref:Phosphoheptose isomerase n=1 Tax=candidate division TA06 bacterium DG_26 TaxID=1703771 RepID=A0A0S7WKB0_UNCT6|nr:MAG: hypothetical protein AMJ40_02580 [candidate division TA06 bacterium DG_26]
MKTVRERIRESTKTLAALSVHAERISEITCAVGESLRRGGKLLVFGNGGSAVQAEHVAAELVVRLRRERQALPAVALTTSTAILSATANDYSFEDVFSRQLEALASFGDIVLALSTSGNSPNVLKGIETANALQLKTIALLGKGGGKLKGRADLELIVDSNSTERIQEAHLLILHIIAEMIESAFCNEQSGHS